MLLYTYVGDILILFDNRKQTFSVKYNNSIEPWRLN